MRILPATLLLLAFSLRAAAHEDLLTLIEDGHWKRARLLVERGMPMASRDPRFLWLASRVRLAYGQFDAAVDLGERAAQLHPQNAEYRYNLSEIYGSIAEKSSLFKQASYGRKCKRAMDAAVGLNPRHTEALVVLMLFYYQAPGLFGGDKNKARAIPGQIARHDPSQGYLAEARLAALEKRPGKLDELYRKAVEANPASYEAQLELARHSLDRRNLMLAERHAMEAVKLHPRRQAPRAILASVSALQGKLDEMEARLAESERLIPGDLTPYYAAAASLLQIGRDRSRAEAYLRKYLAQEPEPTAPSHEKARAQLALAMPKR